MTIEIKAKAIPRMCDPPVQSNECQRDAFGAVEVSRRPRFGFVQENVQRCIAPSSSRFVGQLLQFLKCLLHDAVAVLLVGLVAEINPATQGPWFPCRAEFLLLER